MNNFYSKFHLTIDLIKDKDFFHLCYYCVLVSLCIELQLFTDVNLKVGTTRPRALSKIFGEEKIDKFIRNNKQNFFLKLNMPY